MFTMIEEITTQIVADLPAKIEATVLALHAATKSLEHRRELVSLHAAQIKAEIISAKSDTGKPLYSNDAARDCAITAALAGDETYQDFISEADDAERLKTELAAKLERLRAEYRIALINYEAGRLGRRAA